MSLLLRNGGIYTTLKGDTYQKGIVFGESEGRKWLKVIISDKKGMCRATCFVTNEDHGLTEDDDVATVRIDDFGMISENQKSGIELRKYQSRNGQWYDQLTCKGVKLYKMADSYDGGFEQTNFTESGFKSSPIDEDGQLPF